ncbi:MAG: DMT family transporter [Cyanobacteria bacterium J06635_15]
MGIVALEMLFVVLWSSGFIGAKYGLPYAGPFSLLFIRYVLVAVLLFVWLLYRRELRLNNRAAIARSALIGLLAHAIWLSAVFGAIALGVSPWIVALITALQPMATSVLSGPLLGERVSPMQWVGMVIGLVGVVLVVGTKVSMQTNVPWVGYGLPFISTISLTLATLYQRHINRGQFGKALQIIPSLFVQAVISAIALYPLAVFFEDLQVQWTGQFTFALAWLVVVLSIGAYGLMFKLLEYRTAARVSSLAYLSPPVTLGLGFLLFGDVLTLGDALGLGVTAIGVGLVYRGETIDTPPMFDNPTNNLRGMMP